MHFLMHIFTLFRQGGVGIKGPQVFAANNSFSHPQGTKRPKNLANC